MRKSSDRKFLEKERFQFMRHEAGFRAALSSGISGTAQRIKQPGTKKKIQN